eukprot:236246-Rhodomonas_salina.1
MHRAACFGPASLEAVPTPLPKPQLETRNSHASCGERLLGQDLHKQRAGALRRPASAQQHRCACEHSGARVQCPHHHRHARQRAWPDAAGQRGEGRR